MKIKILIPTLIIFLISCKSDDSKVNAPSTTLPSNTYSSKLTQRLHDRSIEMTNLLNLNRIEKGVDSFEFRIWIISMLLPEELITIKYIDNEWHVTHTFYWTSINRLDSLRTISITPKIDITIFIDSLKSFDLNNFPSQIDLSGFKDNVADGTNYIFEIATLYHYRVFSYHCPDLYDDLGNRKATELLNLISRSTAFVRLCKN